MLLQFLCAVVFFMQILVVNGHAQPSSGKGTNDTEEHRQDASDISTSPTSDPGTPKKKKEDSSSLEVQKAQQELEALRRRPEEYRVLVLGVQIFLGRFGYGTGPFTGVLDEQTRSAIRAYQKYVGLPLTGDIDYLTLKRLTNDNMALDQVLPFLPKLIFHDKDWNRSVRVEGTWTLTRESQPFAPQTTTISCQREWNRCIESTAALSIMHTPYLSVKTHVYEIGAWDETDIVTRPNTSEACTSAIVRINRTQKTVFRLLSIQQEPEGCANVKNQDLHYHLVNGSEIYWNLKQQKAESTKQILRVKQ